MSRIWLAAAVLVGTSFTASGQSIPAEWRELREALRRCNDGWVESLERKDFEVFAQACPQETDGLFWYTAAEAPVVFAGPDGHWQRSSARVQSIAWEELQLVGVRIYDDLALVHYTVTWRPTNSAGQVMRSTSRRLTVFRREDDQWVMVGGSVAGVQ